MMRPTGEASKPVSGDFVAVYPKPAFRHPRCAAPHEPLLWVHGDATVTGRFRNRKLVVSEL